MQPLHHIVYYAHSIDQSKVEYWDYLMMLITFLFLRIVFYENVEEKLKLLVFFVFFRTQISHLLFGTYVCNFKTHTDYAIHNHVDCIFDRSPVGMGDWDTRMSMFDMNRCMTRHRIGPFYG